eukprot:g6986.t1
MFVSSMSQECSVEAFAETAELRAAARAISDAVQAALTLTIQCNGSETLGADGSNGIAVAVALAVSTTEDLEAECEAQAEAVPDAVGTILAEDAVDAIEEGAAAIDSGELGRLRAEPLRGEVLAVAEQTPSLASRIADSIINAVTDILREIQCNCDNSRQTGTCRYVNGAFVGQCRPYGSGGGCNPLPDGYLCDYVNGQLICD